MYYKEQEVENPFSQYIQIHFWKLTSEHIETWKVCLKMLSLKKQN